jgi:hypothetical protein
VIQDGFMRTVVVPVRTPPRVQATGFLDDEIPNSDPPAYDELGTDQIELPKPARRGSQINFDKLVPLNTLGRQSGYIIV